MEMLVPDFPYALGCESLTCEFHRFGQATLQGRSNLLLILTQPTLARICTFQHQFQGTGHSASQFGTSPFGVRGLLPGPFETGMFQEEAPWTGLCRVLEEDPLLRDGRAGNVAQLDLCNVAGMTLHWGQVSGYD